MPYDMTTPNFTVFGKQLAANPYFTPLYYAQFMFPYQFDPTSVDGFWEFDLSAESQIRYQAIAGVDAGITPGSQGFSLAAIPAPAGSHCLVEYEPWSQVGDAFREVDPLYGTEQEVARAHHELAYALQIYRSIAEGNDMIWSSYQFYVLERRNIQRILNTTPANSFMPWRAAQQFVVQLQSYYGRWGVADVFRDMGGICFFNAYVDSPAFTSSAAAKRRYRRCVRQICAVMRDFGYNAAPIYMPWTIQGYATAAAGNPEGAERVPDDLADGLIADMEIDQPGEWSVWAPDGGAALPADYIAQLPTG